MPDEYHILGFDPPSTSNFGFSCFRVSDGEATLVDSGVEIIPCEGDHKRLLHIERFVLSFFDRFPNIRAIAMERSIGSGFAVTRENLAEATGVIKLVCGHRDVEIISVHTGQMGKEMTGSAAKSGKKSRIKRLVKNIFFPEAKTFIEIASYVNDQGKRIEFMEHQADAILLAAHPLLKQGVSVSGPGGHLCLV